MRGQGGDGESTQPSTPHHPSTRSQTPAGSTGLLPCCHDNCSIPAWQGQEMWEISSTHPHRHSSGCGTGSTLPSAPATSATSSTPSSQLSLRRYLHWSKSTLLWIQMFLHIPPKATGLAVQGAGKVLGFEMRICPFKAPLQKCSLCHDPADAQSHLSADTSPPATNSSSSLAGSLLAKHQDTRFPGCPQAPILSGVTGSVSPQSPQLSEWWSPGVSLGPASSHTQSSCSQQPRKTSALSLTRS